MRTLTLNKYGKRHPITFMLNQYASNGNLYVGLITHEEGYEPWSNLTVNFDVKCEKNCSFIDTNNNGNEIIVWLVENGLGYTTGLEMRSSFCTYPEFKFNMDKLLQYVMKGDNHYEN